MAGITVSGAGSGIDIQSIISKLMSVESQPLNNLNTQEATVNAQISAYGSLKSKISDFQTAMQALNTASSYKVFTATPVDTTVLSATADSTAVTGSYAVNVTSVAARDKLTSGAYADATTAVVGQGTLNISVGSNSFSVTIGSTNDTVSGIASAINNSTSNTGVTASVVTDSSGAHLVLSSDNTGTANALTVSGITGLTYQSGGASNTLTAISTAADASITVDNNFTFTSSTNSFTNVVSGLSFTAKAVGSTTVDVARDNTSILKSVHNFADAFNALRKELDTQSKGQLQGDSTLLSIQRQLYGVLNAGSAITGSSYTYLSQAGVSVDKQGMMQVDDTAVTNAINSNYSSFVNLFSASGQGFADRFNTLATNWLEPTNGLIAARTDGLNSQIKSMDAEKTRIQARLDMVQARLTKQYTAMDSLVSTLNSTGTYLTQQLASISKIGG